MRNGRGNASASLPNRVSLNTPPVNRGYGYISTMTARSSAGPGIVRPGTLSGPNATQIPRTSSTMAMPRLAIVFHGSSFSIAINAAMNAIQPKLITPSANNAAINAQQQPTHQAPCLMPIRSAPVRPLRHDESRNRNGSRHFVRQVSLNGVNWYSPAAAITPPATYRP